MTLTRTSELICHPATPANAVTAIHATVIRSAADLAVRFRLEGSIAELRIPDPMRPRFTMRLWEHTCFEAFVAIAGDAAYRELLRLYDSEIAANP